MLLCGSKDASDRTSLRELDNAFSARQAAREYLASSFANILLSSVVGYAACKGD